MVFSEDSFTVLDRRKSWKSYLNHVSAIISQILTSFRENRNIGLAHAYEKINNFENNHTLQLPTGTNVISPEKISVRISNRSFGRISTSKPFNRLVGRSRSNLIHIKPCTGRSNNVPSVMLSNTMSLAPKIDEVRTFAIEFNLDLVCVTETWLREKSAIVVFKFLVISC